MLITVCVCVCVCACFKGSCNRPHRKRILNITRSSFNCYTSSQYIYKAITALQRQAPTVLTHDWRLRGVNQWIKNNTHTVQATETGYQRQAATTNPQTDWQYAWVTSAAYPCVVRQKLLTVARQQRHCKTLSERKAPVGEAGTWNMWNHLLHGHCQSSVKVIAKKKKMLLMLGF